MSIRVLIVDDQAIVREGLQAILSTAPGLEVVGAVEDGGLALEAVRSDPPDVVLMDLKMPVMNGVRATRAIKKDHPEVFVLVLTTYDADEWVFDAIRAGASGYLLKDTPREALIEAVEGTAAGQAHIDPSVARALVAHVQGGSPAPEPAILAELSERERDVLGLLAQGLTNADIAARLYLSEGTVRNYVSAILAKLGVEDRTQAAVFALRHGLGG